MGRYVCTTQYHGTVCDVGCGPVVRQPTRAQPNSNTNSGAPCMSIARSRFERSTSTYISHACGPPRPTGTMYSGIQLVLYTAILLRAGAVDGNVMADASRLVCLCCHLSADRFPRACVNKPQITVAGSVASTFILHSCFIQRPSFPIELEVDSRKLK